ncbi:MAG: 1-deoxy-D-xylulose-5-phosphate reductoisomerase, partial [Synergistaceae bacterium]|nr:1-deoxy-D-xylulose-5-phosphate reductoisomerase [Synergistaceae bacterium]
GSYVHGLVRFIDGTTKMLLSKADMRLPSASAIASPGRLPLAERGIEALEPAGLELRFDEIDEKRFPCFPLALEAGEKGGAYPALLVGADETTVSAFLDGKISFTDIARVVEDVLSNWSGPAPASLEDAIALVGEGRRLAAENCLRRLE